MFIGRVKQTHGSLGIGGSHGSQGQERLEDRMRRGHDEFIWGLVRWVSELKHLLPSLMAPVGSQGTTG